MNAPLTLMDVATFALILMDPIYVAVEVVMHFLPIDIHVEVMSSSCMYIYELFTL